MAEVDTVEIVVDIIDQFSDELRELNAQLERIDAKSLGIDVDINASREITSTEAQLDAMARDRTVDVDTNNLPVLRDELVPDTIDGAAVGGGRSSFPQDPIHVPNISGYARGDGDSMRMAPSLDMGSDFGFGGGGGGSFFNDFSKEGAMGRKRLSRLGSVVSKLTPNMMMMWNVLAAGIPIMVSLGAAAIGLAGALGTVAVAGAAILGVGLLGFGDSFSSSISNATTELQTLGSTLFDVLQPVATTFQPILMGWLEGAPAQVQKIVGPMEDLKVFADVLSAAGSGIMDWTARVLESMVDMEGAIGQMVMRLGTVAGDFLIDWMENMVQFAYDNQTAMIQLAAVVRDLFGALLNISIVVSSTLAQFSFLTDILVFISDILNSRLGRALLMVVAIMISLEAAVAGVLAVLGLAGTAMFGLSGGIISSYLPAVSSAIASTWAWVAGLQGLRQAMAATGIGLALIGGGLLLNEMMPSAGASGGVGTGGMGGGGSGAGGTYINVQGDVGRRELDRVLDRTGGVAREEMSITEDMQA